MSRRGQLTSSGTQLQMMNSLQQMHLFEFIQKLDRLHSKVLGTLFILYRRLDIPKRCQFIAIQLLCNFYEIEIKNLDTAKLESTQQIAQINELRENFLCYAYTCGLIAHKLHKRKQRFSHLIYAWKRFCQEYGLSYASSFVGNLSFSQMEKRILLTVGYRLPSKSVLDCAELIVFNVCRSLNRRFVNLYLLLYFVIELACLMYNELNLHNA